MTKRQMPDLAKLLTATAAPMPDAAEPPPAAPPAANDIPAARVTAAELRAQPPQARRAAAGDETATVNLENLNFKVSKSFRKRFRDCAYRADLKHNELLFAALNAWETLHGGRN
jgi:hypothetical protein